MCNLLAVARRADEVCQLTDGVSFADDMRAAVERRAGSCGLRSVADEIADLRSYLAAAGWTLMVEVCCVDGVARSCYVVTDSFTL